MIAQNNSITLGEIQQLTLLDQASADNLLKSKGFSLKNVSGLSFTYSLADETVDLVSTPRSVTYTTLNANSYITFSDAISKEYLLLNAQDVISVNGQSVIASSFSKPGLKISLWTSNVGQPKFHIQSATFNSAPTVPTLTQEQQAIALSDVKGMRQAAKTKNTIPSFNSAGDGIATKKTRLTFGAGLYRVPYMTTINGVRKYEDDKETLYALNLGLEISKFPTMQKKKNHYVNTRLDLNLTSFMDMQFSYQTTKPDDINYVTNLEILFLTKHYGTIGLISEIRKKNNSFLMCFAPGINWNRGNFEGEKVNVFGGVVQMGEYVQHTFQSKSKEKDSMFIRLGFEQFFSFGLGYIGQFALTFGI